VQAYFFDKGPDYFEEGLARFIENGKIGYMDENLNKIIPAQFDGAGPFNKGKAKVCIGCTKVTDGEYSKMEGGNWGEIDQKGNFQSVNHCTSKEIQMHKILNPKTRRRSRNSYDSKHKYIVVYKKI